MLRPLLRRWRCIALGLALVFTLSSRAQTALTESQAKASAFLNFARFVEWPERAFSSRDAPFVFCIAGRDSLGEAASTLQGRVLSGRATQMRRVLGIEELKGCHALYIGDAEERRLLPMLRAVADEPVLTVGDLSGFTEVGGAIGIVLDDGHIRFDINRTALDQARLRASSNLLRLARNTRQH